MYVEDKSQVGLRSRKEAGNSHKRKRGTNYEVGYRSSSSRATQAYVSASGRTVIGRRSGYASCSFSASIPHAFNKRHSFFGHSRNIVADLENRIIQNVKHYELLLAREAFPRCLTGDAKRLADPCPGHTTPAELNDMLLQCVLDRANSHCRRT